jgi:hypothetical protein
MRNWILILLVLMVLDSSAQIVDKVTGRSYSRTQVLGYSLIGAGLVFVGEGVVSLNGSSSNKPLPLFIAGGACIGGGVILVIKGKNRTKSRKGPNLNPTF